MAFIAFIAFMVFMTVIAFMAFMAFITPMGGGRDPPPKSNIAMPKMKGMRNSMYYLAIYLSIHLSFRTPLPYVGSYKKMICYANAIMLICYVFCTRPGENYYIIIGNRRRNDHPSQMQTNDNPPAHQGVDIEVETLPPDPPPSTRTCAVL